MKRWKAFLAVIAIAFCSAVAPRTSGAEAIPEEKPYITRMLFAYVWPSGYSEVWVMDPPGVHFITNIDMTLFGHGLRLEMPEAIYDLFILPGIFSEDDVRQGQYDGSVDARGMAAAIASGWRAGAVCCVHPRLCLAP